jgi:hypothetical protein
MFDDSSRAAPFFMSIHTNRAAQKFLWALSFWCFFFVLLLARGFFINVYYLSKRPEIPINKPIKPLLTVFLCPSNREAVGLISLFVK